jgi:hypothetical protein
MAAFIAQPDPLPGELLWVDAPGDAQYVVEGSIVQTNTTTLATVIKPLGEYGLMSLRLEMDCSTRRYRPNLIVFYNQDGSLRRSTDLTLGRSADVDWAERNGEGIAARICA